MSFGRSGVIFPLSCTYYDNFRISIFHKRDKNPKYAGVERIKNMRGFILMLKVILERKTDFIIRLISQNYTVNVFCQQSFTFVVDN